MAFKNKKDLNDPNFYNGGLDVTLTSRLNIEDLDFGENALHLGKNNVSVFTFPRRIFASNPQTELALKFGHLKYEPELGPINDIMLFALVLEFFQIDRHQFIERGFSAFYLDVTYHPDYVTFIGVMKNEFEPHVVYENFTQMASRAHRERVGFNDGERFDVGGMDRVMLESITGGGDPLFDGEDLGGGSALVTVNANNVHTNGSANAGANGRGEHQSRRPKKPKKTSVDDDITDSLFFAYMSIRKVNIPVAEILDTVAFKKSPLSWGNLITTPDELADTLMLWIRERFIAKYDANELKFEKGQNVDCIVTHTPTGAPPKQYKYSLVLSDFISATNHLYFDLDVVRPCFYDENPYVDQAPGVYKLMHRAFPTDMSALLSRTFFEFEGLSAFQSKCPIWRLEHSKQNPNEANRTGDAIHLTRFLKQFPRFADINNGAIQTIFQILSTGFVPNAVKQSIVALQKRLVDNNGFLFEAKNAKPIRLYPNLSYSANMILHYTRMFETCGTYYHHVEQLILLLISDTCGFRSNTSNMTPNALIFGPPGTGKSTMMKLIGDVNGAAFGGTSHVTMLANFGRQEYDDFFDCASVYFDEAPGYIVSNQQAIVNAEAVVKKKEKLSNGDKLKATRLVKDTATEEFVQKLYNICLASNPEFCATNAPERDGDPSLMNRYISMYFMHGPRELPLNDKPGDFGSIITEIQLERPLLFILTKLQAEKILPPPDMTVFEDFTHHFLPILRENPFTDLDTAISSGDRLNGFNSQVYIHLVNRLAINQVFFDAHAKFRSTQFDVAQLGACATFMSAGDLQAAIFAYGIMSHMFRSPTELRVQKLAVEDLLKQNVIVTEDSIDFRFDQLDPFCSTKYNSFFDDEEHKTKLNGKYCPLCILNVGNRNAKDPEIYKIIASKFYSSDSVYQMLEVHVVKRIELLVTKQCRGKNAGDARMGFIYKQALGQVLVYVLNDWVAEYFTKKWTFKTMVETAIKRNRFCKPGRYLIPAPLKIGDASDDICSFGSESLQSKLRDRPENSVPQLMDYVDIPQHSPGCTALDYLGSIVPHAPQSPWDTRTPSNAEALTHCDCFRSGRDMGSHDDQDSFTHAHSNVYSYDPHYVSLSLMSRAYPNAGNFVMAHNTPCCKAATTADATQQGTSYPVHVLETLLCAITAPSRGRAASDAGALPPAEEMEV